MMPHNNNKEHTPTIETKNAALQNDNHHTRRLAKRAVKIHNNAVAYLIVVRNHKSKPGSSSRSRRKRSTEYATLEAIDEKSLNDLRKTYKNSLKEITLNPNETPAQALRRYNAEAITEALNKANKRPIELTASADEGEEVKAAMQEQHQQQQKHILSNINDPYFNMPIEMERIQTLYQQQKGVYDPEVVYDNAISKHNTPEVFGAVSYMDAYSVPHVLQPQFPYNTFLKPVNAINKNRQPFAAIENDFTAGHVNHIRESPVELVVSPVETSQFESKMAFIKQQLVDCCNKCKDNMLKVIEETFREKHYDEAMKSYDSIRFNDKSHIAAYRKPHYRERDTEFEQFLKEMTEKGYSKSHLHKQHQIDYLKDDKLNLHIKEQEDSPQVLQRIQAYKRASAVPETKLAKEMETFSLKNKQNSQQLKENAMKKQQQQGEHAETISKNANVKEQAQEIKQISTEIEEDKMAKKSINQEELLDIINVTTSVINIESTTQSAYALRGLFRSHKSNPIAFNSTNQAKRFSTYKNIKKLGSSIKLTNNENSLHKNDKIERVFDIFYDVSPHHSKEAIIEEAKNTEENSKSITTTVMPILSVSPLTSVTNNTHNEQNVRRRKTRLSSISQN